MKKKLVAPKKTGATARPALVPGDRKREARPGRRHPGEGRVNRGLLAMERERQAGNDEGQQRMPGVGDGP